MPNKIYILPTKAGFYFLSTGFILFFISLSYAHNLAFAASFLFISIIIISTIYTNYNLSNISIKGVKVVNGIAEDAHLKIRLLNSGKRKKFGIKINLGKMKSNLCDLDIKEEKTIELPLILARGKYQFNKLTIRTVFPFGIFKSWKNCPVSGECFIYPILEKGASLPPLHLLDQNIAKGASLLNSPGSEDFYGHKKHTQGESWRLVDWKAFAKGRGILAKWFVDESNFSFVFNFNQIHLNETEKKLQRISSWITKAYHSGKLYKLIMPEIVIPLGSGEKHFAHCMEVLSSWERPKIIL